MQKAKAFFADPKNKNVSKIYITSDGNVFRADHYADNWSVNLSDKTITPFTRGSKEKETAEQATADHFEGDQDAQAVDQDGSDERRLLTVRFIDLFDTKPPADASIEEIQKLIADKEAEAEQEDVQGAESSDNADATDLHDSGSTESSDSTETDEAGDQSFGQLDVVANLDKLVAEYISLFGKKPHHKWKAEKISEAIKAKKAE